MTAHSTDKGIMGEDKKKKPAAKDVLPNRKFSTGNPAIDSILGGGIPKDSLYIITGAPGAGKTIFAQQIAFATAKLGLKVVYFTNVSEPHAKLIEHVRQFDFFQNDLIGSNIQIYNITSQIRDKGLKETLDFVVNTVRADEADLIIIDSFRGLKHILDVGVRDRAAIFDLAARLSIIGCTTLLVGEYTGDEIQTDPEFAIADGIIHLMYGFEGVKLRRAMNVAKMRGSSYLSGQHSFDITTRGLTVYPRQEALVRAPRYRATDERVSTGIPDLDEMMRGGPIKSSSTLVVGSAGTGKTMLSLHFLAAGAVKGERGLMVSFQENPEQLTLRASQFGLGNQLGIGEGQTEVLFMSPVELDIDQAAYYIREAVEQRGIRRVVIDSVAELEYGIHDRNRFDDFLASLIGFFRSYEVTTFMTREIVQLFGTDLSISSQGLSYIVDNILLLRYIELRAQIKRTISVLKIRGSDHDKMLRELILGNGEISIGQSFENMMGLMTGMPRFINDSNNDR
jgi:circadian clock protein KaiC